MSALLSLGRSNMQLNNQRYDFAQSHTPDIPLAETFPSDATRARFLFLLSSFRNRTGISEVSLAGMRTGI